MKRVQKMASGRDRNSGKMGQKLGQSVDRKWWEDVRGKVEKCKRKRVGKHDRKRWGCEAQKWENKREIGGKCEGKRAGNREGKRERNREGKSGKT